MAEPAADARRRLPDAVPQAAPEGFECHVFEREFEVPLSRAAVWAWLEDPATFTDGQVWPYRVEFVSADDRPPGFHEGGLNIHHGPFLHLPGLLTEIRDGHYRDLQYFYGAYVGSPRLVRPTRLQFWVSDGPAGTRVRLRLDAFVRRGLAGWWSRGQAWFWARFPRWMTRALQRRASA